MIMEKVGTRQSSLFLSSIAEVLNIFYSINLYDVIYYTKIVDSKDYTALVDICTP